MTEPFRIQFSVLLAVCCIGALPAQDPAAPTAGTAGPELELMDLSLEELMDVPVEVAGRQSEAMSHTAAAVFVLNEPEIRRSGMRSVGELLRLVPGLVISQDVPGAYGFGSRLGEYQFSGMLVLIDGQRLYTTLLRREYFQAIDLPIGVIERIEVVRGPGGARWGDKASQGVINIVTKKAAQAHGARVNGVVGTEERLIGSFRAGSSVGEHSDFYVFGKMAQRDGGHPDTSGDRWDNNSVGMRFDTMLAPGVDLTVDGLYHDSFLGDSYEIDPGFTSMNMIKGGHVKSKATIAHDDDHTSELRVAFDGYDQDIRDFRDQVEEESLRYREELFEASVRHSWQVALDHHVSVGVGIRTLTVENFRIFAATGAEYNETRGDLFASWDWDIGDHVRITLGGNVGYQDGLDGSGVDAQPDVRLAWTPENDLTVWAAVGANKEPDRKIADSGLLVHRRSSSLLSYELGVRRRFGEVLMLQLDTFAYDVRDQLNGFGTDPGTGATTYETGGRTTAFGGEAIVTWKPLDHLRTTTWLAVTEANSRNIDESQFTTPENDVPPLRGGATIGFDPVPGLELDTNILYMQRRAGIPRWWRVDLRLGWRASENTSIDLVGQNLTDPHHQEYYYLEEAQRGVYLMVTHRF